MSTRARAHVVVSGRVQGVAFRAHAIEEARRLGLDGWVRNLDDGRVEALAEGERPKVEELVAWLRHGPRHARVDRAEVAWEEARGGLGPFDVRF